jgi:hypothetical protein
MSLTVNVKLDQTIVPCVPFIWYREQELTCPIDYIGKVTQDKAQSLFGIDKDDLLVVVQRNISDKDNLYLCLHSLLYYEMHKNKNDELLVIPDRFNVNMPFEVHTLVLNDTVLCELAGGLKNNSMATGSVFIHNCAFSPCGCFQFKIDLNRKQHTFLCNIKCDRMNINLDCLFVLFNDTQSDCNTESDELVEKMKS